MIHGTHIKAKQELNIADPLPWVFQSEISVLKQEPFRALIQQYPCLACRWRLIGYCMVRIPISRLSEIVLLMIWQGKWDIMLQEHAFARCLLMIGTREFMCFSKKLNATPTG